MPNKSLGENDKNSFLRMRVYATITAPSLWSSAGPEQNWVLFSGRAGQLLGRQYWGLLKYLQVKFSALLPGHTPLICSTLSSDSSIPQVLARSLPPYSRSSSFHSHDYSHTSPKHEVKRPSHVKKKGGDWVGQVKGRDLWQSKFFRRKEPPPPTFLFTGGSLPFVFSVVLLVHVTQMLGNAHTYTHRYLLVPDAQCQRQCNLN